MNIDQLLSCRSSRRIESGGNADVAIGRLEHSKYIAENYSAFDLLRRHLLHEQNQPFVKENGPAEALIRHLLKLGWIVKESKDKFHIAEHAGLREYLSGGWLEELTFFAHKAAGADEAYFSQKIQWKVDGITGRNEIDVIARRGDVLSFTSCKSIRPMQTIAQMGQLRNFLTETDYWNIHFADDKGKALLVITSDMVDELDNNRHRFPSLLARATILDVSIAGLETIPWEHLVETIKMHWE